MKTALQQAIEKTLQQYDSLNVWTQFNEGYAYGLQAAISILTEHLPIEREIIEGAYNAGSDDKFYCVTGELGLVKYDDKADYYNQTFNQTDKNENDDN